MAEITIRYTANVAGHPDNGAVVTVERTEIVDGLLAAGLAVEVASSEVEKGEVLDEPASPAAVTPPKRRARKP